MRNRYRLLVLLLAALMLLCSTAGALRQVEDRKDCSITLLLGEGEDHLQNPLRGGTVALYLVAGVCFGDALSWDPSLGQFPEAACLAELGSLSAGDLDSQNASLSAALLAQAKEMKLEPLQTASIEEGKARFSGLSVGLYLLTQTEPSAGGRSMKTFLLAVPDGTGAYDVTAAPKPGLEQASPEPTEPTAPARPTDPRIPKTGQLWWPVPVMTALGLGLLGLGLGLRGRGKEREE